MADNETDARGRRRGPSDEELRGAVPRDRGRREVRVGIFVLAGILAVVAALFLLTSPATLRGRYMLVTQVDDAGGIRRGDPVQMRGVNIGRINSFHMTSGGKVDITMEVEGQWEIPRDSYTELAGAGLFGGRTMEIVRGTADQMAAAWDTLPSAAEQGGLMESAEAVGNQAEEVLKRINNTLSEPTIASVQGTASELQSLISELRTIAQAQRTQLAQLTASLNRSARGLEAASEGGPSVARAAASADTALATLTRTSETLDQAAVSLNTILGRMERGEGTLGRLTADDSLYVNLNRAAESIHLLAQDIRLHPGRYFKISLF